MKKALIALSMLAIAVPALAATSPARVGKLTPVLLVLEPDPEAPRATTPTPRDKANRPAKDAPVEKQPHAEAPRDAKSAPRG